jgi:hypothetical protein
MNKTPFISLRFLDDGLMEFKCVGCQNHLTSYDSTVSRFKFCPFCGREIDFRKFQVGERKQKIIDAYNRRFPNDKAFDWNDIKYYAPSYNLPSGIRSVTISCLERIERVSSWEGLNMEPTIEQDIEEEVLAIYNKSMLKVNYSNRSIYDRIKEDLVCFHETYKKMIEEYKNKSVYDDEFYMSVLRGYKIIVRVEREGK